MEVNEINEINEINEQDFFSDFASDTDEANQGENDNFFEEPAPDISQAQKAAKKEAAKFIINRADDAIKLICTMIADENPDRYGASKKDLKELKKLLEAMLPDGSAMIPPGLMLLITGVFIYAPVVKKAFKDRKKKKEGNKKKLLTEINELNFNVE